jgi:regulation of enolase protein 1 (concanavalin A-like superfamily)
VFWQTNDEWPILLQIDGTNNVWYSTDKIQLKLLNESTLDVWLPELTFGTGNTEYKFYVAEDGSTYWARSDHGVGNDVTQDGAYAMLYDEGGLAASAFDARYAKAVGTEWEKRCAARSPAVNAGSVDGYDYDTTSTNPKRIDLDVPDIGYHYHRRITDDDPIDTNQSFTISFRAPKEEVLRTLRYEATVDALVTTWVDHDPSAEILQDDVNFYPPVSIGRHGLELKTEAVTGAVSTEADEAPLLVDPYPPAAGDVGITITATGAPEAESKVYWNGEDKVYFNNSESDLTGVSVNLDADSSVNPWKTRFGKRSGNQSETDEWVHFQEYELFDE